MAKRKTKRGRSLGLVKHDWRKARARKMRDPHAKRKKGTFTFEVERNHSGAPPPAAYFALVCRAGKSHRGGRYASKNKVHPKRAGASQYSDTLCEGATGRTPTAAVKKAGLRFFRTLR